MNILATITTAVHSIMKGPIDVYELLWTANFLQDLPKPFPVKGFGRSKAMVRSLKEVLMLLLILLLYLSGSEDHVGSTSAGAEAILTLWQNFMKVDMC
jgi:hypothetical protein